MEGRPSRDEREGKPRCRRRGDGSPGDCSAPSRRRPTSRPAAESTPGGGCFLSFFLVTVSLSLSLSRSHCIPLGSLSRALLFRYYRHPRSYTPANCPSHLDQLSLSLSLFFIFSLLPPLSHSFSLSSLFPFRSPSLQQPSLTLCLPLSGPASLSRGVALQKQAYGYPQ